ncbi:MAG: NAD(P)/FAD-dependent oxidoreductase [Thermoflexia bacterium]|nr:MAG: NAD(P)/FAD-dependent oxidoreductase [Thermoflexia bacterium]
MSPETKRSVIIIGAGVAGLSAGRYAQMYGYQSHIFEMHTLPGGLCTSWQRKGYTIDGCIHWLVGSSPSSPLYPLWEEVGAVRGKEFLWTMPGGGLPTALLTGRWGPFRLWLRGDSHLECDCHLPEEEVHDVHSRR